MSGMTLAEFNAWRAKQRSGKPQGSATRMTCNECGHQFRKVIGRNTFEVRCPKCKGYDTEPAA